MKNCTDDLSPMVNITPDKKRICFNTKTQCENSQQGINNKLSNMKVIDEKRKKCETMSTIKLNLHFPQLIIPCRRRKLPPRMKKTLQNPSVPVQFLSRYIKAKKKKYIRHLNVSFFNNNMKVHFKLTTAVSLSNEK